MKVKHFLIFALILFWSGTQLIKAQVWGETSKIVASDRTSSDLFGGINAVDIDGDYAVIGAPYKGLNNDGAAYAYQRDRANCEWVQVQKLSPVSPLSAIIFGSSVAISQNFIAVGALNDSYDANGNNYLLNAGAVYIFENIAGVWTQTQKIVSADREAGAGFGVDVDLDNGRLITGSFDEDGDNTLPNIASSGAAYIFDYNGTTWVQSQKLTASDRGYFDWFGNSVAISGNYAVIGADFDDKDENGLNPVNNAGSAYVFEIVGGTWTQVEKLISTDRGTGEGFGKPVDIDGENIIIGCSYDSEDENGIASLSAAGSAFIYTRAAGQASWPLNRKVDATDRAQGDRFGFSVSIDGGTAVVGAGNEAENATGMNTVTSAGSAYLFQENGGAWSQFQKIVASDRQVGDAFGLGAAISSNAIIVGAPSEDHNQGGSSFMNSSGSAYVYELEFSPSDRPTITMTNTASCAANSSHITLEISAGDLNDGTEWQWYEGSCNSTPIGTGTSIVVTPNSQTTYYVNGIGLCYGPCGSIAVTPSSYWHKSTKNTAGEDLANDVTTDSDGNVYVVGQFILETTLDGGANPDITISTGSGAISGSYLAKYDECGDLIWEAHSNTSLRNEGKSIVVDEVKEIVYIAGNFETFLQFTSSLNPPSSPIQISHLHGQLGYVAGFNMSDGSEVSLDHIIMEDAFTSADVIELDKQTSALFIGGTMSEDISGVPHTSYVSKYNPGFATILPAVASIVSNGGSDNNQINDLDFDESTSRLYVIGDFENEVEFSPGALLQVINPTTVQQDAFLLSYEVGATAFYTVFNVRGNTKDFMSGEGIVADPNTGKIYFTGTYSKRINSPFQFAGIPSLNAASYKRAYMIGYDLDDQIGWSRFARVAFNSAYGKSVTLSDNQLYFTGNFNTQNVFIQTLGIFPATPVAQQFDQHVYVSAFDTDGTGVWANVTTDPSATAIHNAESIAADTKGHVFTVGSYTETLDYYTSNIATPLVASGTGSNAYILRSETKNGKFRMLVEEELETTFDAIIIPNPTSGTGKFVLSNFDDQRTYTIRVTDILGHVILESTLKEQEYYFDLTNQVNGIYFIQLMDGASTSISKLIKTN